MDEDTYIRTVLCVTRNLSLLHPITGVVMFGTPTKLTLICRGLRLGFGLMLGGEVFPT